MGGYKVGQKVWVRGSAEWVWEVAEVEQVVAEDEVVVQSQSHNRMLTNLALPCNVANEGGYPDVCAMTYINEATILSNLHRRSYVNRPYTFMGPVLLAVNPLMPIENKAVIEGDPSVALRPHPFAVAEGAFMQLKFGVNQRRRHAREGGSAGGSAGGDAEAGPVSQTVVVGGESGAGKTESSKMVLKHLVTRCGGGALDARLLGTNPILESFGNAATLRNTNSSRFGKLMKLHFNDPELRIVGASVSQYLLERSRVTSHEKGERGYHIFYQLLAGVTKDKSLGLAGQSGLDKELGIVPGKVYRYLSPGGAGSSGGGAVAGFTPNVWPAPDSKHYVEVRKAFKDVGVPDAKVLSLYRVAAAVLNLGNVEFEDDDRPAGFVAEVAETPASQTALSDVCRALGFADKEAFSRMFCERTIKSGSESITTFLEADQARDAADAVARTLYSRLFNYIIELINDNISDGAGADSMPDDAVIGVLDIFGFESFQHNDFEQLLINYTNESLQATFNEQIFHAEAELYQREQLVLDSGDKMHLPEGNAECMALLEGEQGGKGKVPGILQVIDQEAKLPKANDGKLNDRLHKMFGGKNGCFAAVHPKDVDRVFVVVHYAGPVRYTVGSFLPKNSDTMPKVVDDVMAGAQHPLMADIWASRGPEPSKAKAGKKKKKANAGTSIVAKFRDQIIDLKDYLDSTRCSFIRCVKPNARMVREGETWFDRRYVTQQLKALSVLSTAEVLKNGFPTRLSYDDLTESYSSILPDSALRSWRGLGGGSVTGFVAALFWAFHVPRGSYKLGLTKVFFRSGMLAELDGILTAAAEWGQGGGSQADREAVVDRFSRYFARRRWRVAYAKAVAVGAFSSVMARTQGRGVAAAKIQRWFRSVKDAREYRQQRMAALIMQKRRRGILGRRAGRLAGKERAKRAMREEKEMREKMEQAARDQAEAEARQGELKREREAKEKEAGELRRKKEAADKRAANLQKQEKQLEKVYAKLKKNNARLMAKKQKQLRELEEAGNHDFFGDDGGIGAVKSPSASSRDRSSTGGQSAAESEAADRESEEEQKLEAVRKGIEEEAQLASEAVEAAERLQQEIDAGKTQEAEAASEAKVARKRAESTARDYKVVEKKWRATRKLFENKLEERRAHNEEQAGIFDEEFGEEGIIMSTSEYLTMRHTGYRRKSNKNVFRYMLNQTRRSRRATARKSIIDAYGPGAAGGAGGPSLGGLGRVQEITDSDADSDAESDHGYNAGHVTTEEAVKMLRAPGTKPPVKQSMLRMLQRPWKKRDFVLNVEARKISYYPRSGHKSDGAKPNGAFVLNSMQSTNPCVITVQPKEYAARHANVLRFKGGHLAEDYATRSIEKRKRTLYVAFDLEENMLEWVKALLEFLDPDQHDIEGLELPTLSKSPTGRSLHRATTTASVARSFSVDDDDDDDELAAELAAGIDDGEKEGVVKKWMARAKITATKFGSKEVDRMLLNPRFFKKDKYGHVIDDDVGGGSVATFCQECNATQMVGIGESLCPTCGKELT